MAEWAVPTAVAEEEWAAAAVCARDPQADYRDEAADDPALTARVIEADRADPEVALHHDVRLTNYSDRGLLSYYS